MWAAGGAPVKTIYPADGTLATMEGVAIIKNGPDRRRPRPSSIS
jgi:iron(III) transport system substrate-binding protein